MSWKYPFWHFMQNTGANCRSNLSIRNKNMLLTSGASFWFQICMIFCGILMKKPSIYFHMIIQWSSLCWGEGGCHSLSKITPSGQSLFLENEVHLTKKGNKTFLKLWRSLSRIIFRRVLEGSLCHKIIDMAHTLF